MSTSECSKCGCSYSHRQQTSCPSCTSHARAYRISTERYSFDSSIYGPPGNPQAYHQISIEICREPNQRAYVSRRSDSLVPVVIDDALAFCGGIDLTLRRWDCGEHTPDDPRRLAGDKPYPPFHDTMMAVDGEAAASPGSAAGSAPRSAPCSARCGEPPCGRRTAPARGCPRGGHPRRRSQWRPNRAGCPDGPGPVRRCW